MQVLQMPDPDPLLLLWRRRELKALRTALLVLAAGCGGREPVTGPPDAGQWWAPALAGCSTQQGEAPRTVYQVVERINALPAPVSVACVIASLPRPLSLVATTSVFSAQPADGRRSPRVFLMSDHLVLSVVLGGAGARLLELGEVVADGRTLKAELPFPVTGPIGFDAPFAQVRSGPSQTSCGLCHRAEAPHPSIDGGFVSAAFRPDPGNLVPLSELRAELASCDPAIERERCELLVALLGLGATDAGVFSKKFELFLQ